MKHGYIIATTMTLALGSGCGGLAGALPGIGSHTDASAGFRALADALGRGEGQLSLLHHDETEGDYGFRGAALDAAVGIDVPCADGGSLSLDGSLSTEGLDDIDVGLGGLGSDVAVGFELNVELDGCRQAGITIDGEMSYVLDVDLSAELDDAHYRWAYLGHVDFTGAVTGSCDIDASAESNGVDDSLDARALDGHVCGFAAGDLDL